MRCSEVQSWFGEYCDLSKDDLKRIQIEEHIGECAACAEEFAIWQESVRLIQTSHRNAVGAFPRETVAAGVMDRIYQDEAWRMPIPDRTYTISYKLRRNLTMMIALCIAIFAVALFHSVWYPAVGGGDQPLSGIFPVGYEAGDSIGFADQSSVFEGIPMASISSPTVLRMDQFPKSPDYWLAVSLFGVISALLIMNWLSRIKA